MCRLNIVILHHSRTLASARKHRRLYPVRQITRCLVRIAYVEIPCNDVTVCTFLAGTSGLCNSDISSDRKSSETRMAEQRPREVSRSGLVAVSDPQPMLLLPRRSALGHLHEGDA
ncbi:hypothetical protein CBL_00637 [Carabus blaptoides fortunei]